MFMMIIMKKSYSYGIETLILNSDNTVDERSTRYKFSSIVGADGETHEIIVHPLDVVTIQNGGTALYTNTSKKL